MAMTPRERVLAAMKQEKLDRPPVAVFTQSATIDQMDALNIYWPEAHSNAKMMCELGAAQATVFGFEAVRSSFCLTAEASNSTPCPVNTTSPTSCPLRSSSRQEGPQSFSRQQNS